MSVAETATVTLAEFLLARIAEDEHRAQVAAVQVPQTRSDGATVWGVWLGSTWHQSAAFAAHVTAHLPPRVLAECEAKRRIVAALGDYQDGHIWASGESSRAEDALMALAIPYASHPEFSTEWAL